MNSEWWAEQRWKTRFIVRMWISSVLIFGGTVLWTQPLLRMGFFEPHNLDVLFVAMPLGIVTAAGGYYFLFIRGQP